MTEADVAEWAREELGLDPAALIRIEERESNDPRCSPVVTQLTIEPPGESPFTFHIERPLAEVERMDVVATIAFGGGH
ncbi:MAG: hypothetical protein M3144_04525 [Actinomycetota bacterium]|nr:hypothetical protein [Actinomycetota bacterium]